MQQRFRFLVFLGMLAIGLTPALAQSGQKNSPTPTGKPDVSGSWSLQVETPQGSGSPKVTFVQDGEKLTGTYKGMFGESKITGTLKGYDLQFSVPVNAQGTDLIITYSGRLEKDGLKGTVKFGDLGDGTWTATRVKPEEAKKEEAKKKGS